jgi:glutamate-1-semialdehyde 2,1-aminomutase
MREVDVPAHAARIGEAIMSLWRAMGARHGLPIRVPEGYPCLAHFAFEHPLANELKTLYTQRMLHQGFLAGAAVYPTLGHSDAIIDQFGEALDKVFGELADALARDAVKDSLEGPPAYEGFRRLL